MLTAVKGVLLLRQRLKYVPVLSQVHSGAVLIGYHTKKTFMLTCGRTSPDTSGSVRINNLMIITSGDRMAIPVPPPWSS